MFFCINSGCKYVLNDTFRKLQTAAEHEAILYTSSFGPIPVQAHQFTCNGCGIVYHLDYFVHTIPGMNDQRRVYYNEDVGPQVLQVSTHHFIETSLVRMWRSNMLHAWVSASNTVKVYDSCWPKPWAPPDWTVSANLQYKYVYNGFKLLLLLEWHKSHLSILMVPQTIDQACQFEEAMVTMKLKIAMNGQVEVNHQCNKCVCIIKKDDKGKCM
ncbi:hypothetical protein BT96DRAFT_829382 [Gymnopus androsaceus JB14]|uniref:CxC5 like cysteine cluster associated with KDZ domain-containing protein n=1 Tax=Gymnopus androsaceus JB14 TaxID=1447944 RepID=A0A6A4H6K0_9AGAR|nr:hypothetical protein BT96DRAFT_829382 [Gymnopus androsaceus JB14]